MTFLGFIYKWIELFRFRLNFQRHQDLKIQQLLWTVSTLMQEDPSNLKAFIEGQLNEKVEKCGEKNGIICDEIYSGPKTSWKWKSTWKLSCEKSLKDLITIINVQDSTLSINEYPDIEIVQVGANIRTPYALLALEPLTRLTKEAKLERSLRLLQRDNVGVVSGATRNSTGFWRANCRQFDFSNYVLRNSIKPESLPSLNEFSPKPPDWGPKKHGCKKSSNEHVTTHFIVHITYFNLTVRYIEFAESTQCSEFTYRVSQSSLGEQKTPSINTEK